MIKAAIATIMAVAALTAAACSPRLTGQQAPERSGSEIFSKGSRVKSENFTGEVWVHMLVETDTVYNTQIGNVTFAPGARSNWHSHPSGQILLVTEGLGYYQEKGMPIRLIRKGELVKCLPNVTHWHGASPDRPMSHIAISPSMDKGRVVWLEKVTDEEYNSFQ